MHFISYIQCFEEFFKNQVIFSKLLFLFFLFKISINPSVFRSIEITFKILCELLSVSINWNSWIRFLKTQIWLVQTNFSLSLQLGKALQRFFVIFLQISCKVSLSLSQYVYITLPFALIFTFSCIISWFLGIFQTIHNLGFLINQPLFYEVDQWVLLLQCCIHDLYWLIWSIWGFVKN